MKLIKNNTKFKINLSMYEILMLCISNKEIHYNENSSNSKFDKVNKLCKSSFPLLLYF